MAKKHPKFLLFKLEPKLERLDETILSEKKIKERHIQNLFKENLSKVFDLIYLKDEHCLINPDSGEKDCRADTLAFSKSGNFFVIIEYKRGESLELYEQAAEYISCLKDTKNPECIHNGHELVGILNDKEKSRKWGWKDILWKETKGICIATEIDKRLRHHQRPGEQKDENIKIVEIKFYDNEKLLYIDTNNLPEWLTIASLKSIKNDRKTEEITLKPKTIDDILNTDWIRAETKDWLNKIRKILFAKQWLNEEFKPIDYKKYYPVIYYSERVSGKKVFSLVVKAKQINIKGNWPAKIFSNLVELLNKYKVEYDEKGRVATVDWWFPPIKNSSDLQNLTNFFQEYQKQFFEKQQN